MTMAMVTISSCSGSKKNENAGTAIAGPTLSESAARGETVFNKSGCNSCHHSTIDQVSKGLGPSLVSISAAYKTAGGQTALVEFLGGNDKPIVNPEKYGIMKNIMNIIKRIPEKERSDLADYIMSY